MRLQTGPLLPPNREQGTLWAAAAASPRACNGHAQRIVLAGETARIPLAEQGLVTGHVLVKFKSTAAAARVAKEQGSKPLTGLALQRLVGKRHGMRVPRGGGRGSLLLTPSCSSK